MSDRIAILAPVLNRPGRVAPLTENVLLTAPEAMLLYLVSPDDHAELKAVRSMNGGAAHLIIGNPPGPGDYARKINCGYESAASAGFDWIFTGADDLRFYPDWAEQALAVAQKTGKRVIGTQDLCNPTVKRGMHSTHTLVHVSYVEELGASWDGPGVVLHEGYDHQCVDNELVQVALEHGEWAFAAKSVVEHLHWICGKGTRDATADKAFARGRDDIRLYQERLKRYGRKT